MSWDSADQESYSVISMASNRQIPKAKGKKKEFYCCGGNHDDPNLPIGRIAFRDLPKKFTKGRKQKSNKKDRIIIIVIIIIIIFTLDPTLDLLMIVIYHHHYYYILLMAGFMDEMTKLLN